MEEVILKHSKFATQKNNYGSYDVIEYDNKYYCGTNLYKYFANYLSHEWHLPVLVMDNEIEAYNHFNNILF